jgi:hypothetical protein
MEYYPDKTFDPLTLAGDLREIQRIYANFFDGLTGADWERPVKGSPQEWNLHETVAHLCALNGAGLESIRCALQGERYIFAGLTDRYQFNAYNRRGIDAHLPLPTEELCAELLDILAQAAHIAGNLQPAQAEIASEMPIYNRPVKIVEALSIIMFHAGLNHTAQVAEPARVPPLWTQLSSDIRHLLIGRVMRALSLLYRFDLGADLQAIISFRVDGPGGGNWYVDISPESATSGQGSSDHPSLTIRLRNTDVFCKMFTGRFNLPLSLLTGQIRLRGDLRLFTRFGSLFSVDAHPAGSTSP